MGRRRSAWKIAGLVLLGLLVLVGAFLGWMEWTTSRGWADLRRRSQAETAAELARPVTRTFLRPPRGTGQAWKDYGAAATDAKRLSAPEDALVSRYLRTDDADLRGEIRLLLEGFGVALRKLESGASSREAGMPERDPGGGTTLTWRLLAAAQLALCAARLDIDRGREAEGVERIGQVLQLARDLLDLRPGQGLYKAQAVLGQVREQLGHLLTAKKLGPSGRAELERLLEAVDASWPSGESVLERVGVETRRRLVEAEEAGELGLYRGNPRGLLQSMLSDRQRALTFEQSGRAGTLAARGSDAWDGTTFREFLRNWEEDAGGVGFLMYVQILRQARAETALMRAALAWVRTGETPRREDPAGTFLRSRDESGGLLLWSWGWNGIDDGGGQKDVVLRACR